MADNYMIGDVTVDPQGGGYYDLTTAAGAKHRVRGKQAAEETARSLATPKGDAEAVMPVQPPFDEAVAATTVPPTIQTTTVRIDESIPAPATHIPVGQVPNQFTGVMPEDVRGRLAQLGVTTSRVVLEESDSIPPTGLFVAHNGRSYMIRPGEEVDVPDFILEVLNNAVMSTPNVDPVTKRVLGYRSRSKYPYRRV